MQEIELTFIAWPLSVRHSSLTPASRNGRTLSDSIVVRNLAMCRYAFLTSGAGASSRLFTLPLVYRVTVLSADALIVEVNYFSLFIFYFIDSLN